MDLRGRHTHLCATGKERPIGEHYTAGCNDAALDATGFEGRDAEGFPKTAVEVHEFANGGFCPVPVCFAEDVRGFGAEGGVDGGAGGGDVEEGVDGCGIGGVDSDEVEGEEAGAEGSGVVVERVCRFGGKTRH